MALQLVGGTRILSVAARPLRETSGAVLTFTDLTEIKELEARAERQSRLAELGEMAAGVAHEIRNPLGGIELYASTLKRRLPPHSHEAEIAEKIGEAATALNRIVTDMLTFTRRRELTRKICDPEQIIRAAWDMAGREREQKKITATWQCASHGRKIALDADQLTQAALNVILNAVQFSPPGGKLTLKVYFVAAPIKLAAPSAPTAPLPAPENALPEKAAPENLVYEFIDDGPGISAENVAKIFNPFFTTRQEGTGLGLAIVHKIIIDHGGAVTVENRPPRGAAFIFTLPVVAI
jgi:signal transduction histidine kinase